MALGLFVLFGKKLPAVELRQLLIYAILLYANIYIRGKSQSFAETCGSIAASVRKEKPLYGSKKRYHIT